MWPVFMLGSKIRTVLEMKLNGLQENVKNVNSSALEAEEFQNPRWLKYCETPCTLHSYNNLQSFLGIQNELQQSFSLFVCFSELLRFFFLPYA